MCRFYFFLLFMLVFMCGCAGPRPFYVHPNVQDMKPTMQVFVAPRGLVDTRNQKALVLWANVSEEMPPAYSSEAITRCLQDIFLQYRVFLVTALSERNAEIGGKTGYASDKGFDYIIQTDVPPMIIPVGNTPGWVGLDIKIKDARSGVTVWHIYGEVNLVPEAGNYGIFWDRPSRPAPSAAQGIISICRAAADIILRGNARVMVQ